MLDKEGELLSRDWLVASLLLRSEKTKLQFSYSSFMANDFVPRSLANQKTWFTGLKAGITTDGPTLRRTPAEVTADTAFIDSILTPITDALDKETAAMEALGLARATMSTNLSKLRTLINNYKSSPGWNPGMGDAWQVNSSATQYDMTSHAPTIVVKNEGGQTVIRGQKPGFTSVSIDMRLAGATAWTVIGMKLSHFPLVDNTAPQTPGKPEKREYRARGYVGDQEMGQPSDIVSAIFNS